MVITKSETALRRLLIQSFPDVELAIENVPFQPSPDADIYMAVQFVINPPTDPTYGPYYYRENISFQVFISDKLGKGTGDAKGLAEQVREVFYKGLSLEEDGYRLHILRTPQISGSVVTSDRLIVPLMIPVEVEVYKS